MLVAITLDETEQAELLAQARLADNAVMRSVARKIARARDEEASDCQVLARALVQCVSGEEIDSYGHALKLAGDVMGLGDDMRHTERHYHDSTGDEDRPCSCPTPGTYAPSCDLCGPDRAGIHGIGHAYGDGARDARLRTLIYGEPS